MEAATKQQAGNGHSPDDGPSGTEQAKEKAGEYASQAREQVSGAAGQAQERVRTEIDKRSTEAGDKVTETADDLRTVGDELRNQGKETPAKFAEQAADRVEKAGSYLRDSDAERMLHDAETLGRRQPWAVLAGTAVAGLVAARFLKASSERRYTSGQAPAASSAQTR